MLFTVNSQDLLDGLRTVTRALSARPAKQILEGVLIDAEDDHITLTCSDGTLTIEHVITASVEENGRVVLPGKLFTDLCARLPGGNVTIQVKDGRSASIKCGSSRSNMSCMNAMEYPEMNEITTGYPVELPQNKLRDMISHVVFSIATDESRQILTGCLLELSATETRMVALDGFRLAMQKLDKGNELPEGKELMRFVLPGRVMTELSKILADSEEPCGLLMAKNQVQATFGSTRLSSVLLAGEFIDYRKILPTAFKTTASVDRATVQNAIDRASLMAMAGKNNLIRMSFKEGSLSITSNADLGDVLEEMDAQLDGDPISISFNAKYITDVIRNMSDERLFMCFNSAVSPCVIQPEDGDSYLYLILPVRTFQ